MIPTEIGPAEGGCRAPGHGTPLLELRDVSCAFGGVKALDRADLEIRPGEVHGLLGENGSGKSTLIKVLAGYHDPLPGARFRMNGREVPFPLEPGLFRSLGISFVHQDLGLVRSLTVLENLKAGMLAEQGTFSRIRWGAERRSAIDLFERYGVNIHPDEVVEELSDLDRARLAIVRAAHEIRSSRTDGEDGQGLLVLDEPTVFLPGEGVEELFSLVREVVAQDASVLFVSHDLDEVMAITDRVTILRNGKVQGELETASASRAEIVNRIVGQALNSFVPTKHVKASGPIRLQVTDLSGQTVNNVSFSVHAGEVLGMTGLIGSGFEEAMYIVGGAQGTGRLAGQVSMDGVERDAAAIDVRTALAAGTVLVPGDRAAHGVALSLNLEENITLPVLSRYFEHGFLSESRMRAEVKEILTQYTVKPTDSSAPAGTLSGGNQQKVVLAKCLQTEPSVLLLHEPTQGVDIGARQQIYSMIEKQSERMVATVCASTDADQLATLCDRVLIFNRGRIVSELQGDEVTKENISARMYDATNAETGSRSLTNAH